MKKVKANYPNPKWGVLAVFLLIGLAIAIGKKDDQPLRAFARNPFQSSEPYLYLPLIVRSASETLEWSQHAHNAQRTSYTPQTVAYPWRWRWAWNGPDERGSIGKVTSNGSLPRNVQPVTGDGRVYIAAGQDGVFALDEATGGQIWNRRMIGQVNSTVAYDQKTRAIFVVSANGMLYKLNAADGQILGEFASGATSLLPLPPLLLPDRVIFAMGKKVFALDKDTLTRLWVYDANVDLETPPSYSATRNLVIVGDQQLYVHAISNSNGTGRWRVRPVHPDLAAGETSDGYNFAEYRYGWPVVSENAGYVLMKVRLDWESLYPDFGITNDAIRHLLQRYPKQQALFVLDLDNGSVPFIANIGHGGYGDQSYLPMGPQPVVKQLPNGKDIVYTVIRGHNCHPVPWTSHFGEMVLDDTTVSGLSGGEIRWIAYDWQGEPEVCSYLLTDEQPNVSMAGDVLFGGHWEAGLSLRILDRSDSRGTFYNRITSEYLPTIVTSQDNPAACPFSPSHFCPNGLENTRPYNPGFYIYYRQGNVYDRYWSEYAVWTVSNQNIYFRSADGAVVALTSGNPELQDRYHKPLADLMIAPSVRPNHEPSKPEAVIDFHQARQWAEHWVIVTGEIKYINNNGKKVLLGFSEPHRGYFKVLILKEHWSNFPSSPEKLYQAGQTIQVSGIIGWYQGDPVIYVSDPDQIR